ncbi:MAG: hypothetical protein A2X46_04960 [Lentisphaerae bacterium GWF2_57_35]|nr:MAG: hypothetical protein A2X46_04960 [Lentisphaerae bacterium GWF2_57_35]
MRFNQGSQYRLPLDVIFQPGEGSQPVATNVFTRSHVEVDFKVLEILFSLSESTPALELLNRLRSCERQLFARDLTWFSNQDGLLADPSQKKRKQMSYNAPGVFSAEEILTLLVERCILVPTDGSYERFLGRKQNMFDDASLGNFHQQLGRFLLLEKRQNPDNWWVQQKFAKDGEQLRDNLYRFVQYSFYERTFTPQVIGGKRVLDVGCGVGFYSRHFARQGAYVLGIDPSAKYIDLAKKHTPAEMSADFLQVDIASGSALEQIDSESFDLVVFQDALLFYFVSPGNQPVTTINKVLSELRRVMKSDGRIFVLEPHGIFWLQPWMGELKRPFTVLTEYQHKWHGVTPTLAQMSSAFATAGLLIERIDELNPAEEAKKYDERAYVHSREFPQWWAFWLRKGCLNETIN